MSSGPCCAAFSHRNEQVEAEKDRRVAQFVAALGRQPTATEVIDLRRRATLFTRPEKDTAAWLP